MAGFGAFYTHVYFSLPQAFLAAAPFFTAWLFLIRLYMQMRYQEKVVFSLVLHLQGTVSKCSHSIIKYAVICGLPCEVFVNALYMCGHSIMISQPFTKPIHCY